MKKMMMILACTLACAGTPVSFAHPPTADIQQYVSDHVKIVGQVKQTLNLSVEDLKKYPQLVQEVQISKKNGDVSEVIRYQGVRLTDVLDAAEVVTAHHNDVKKMVIIASAKDDYHVVFSWNELFNSPLGKGVILIYAQDGKALDDKTGRLALISSQDHLTGPRFVKWLNQIKVVQLTDFD